MTNEAAEPDDAASAEETVETHEQVEVKLVRAVRYGPIILTATGIGAVLGMIAALLVPVAEDAEYTLGQVVGQMAVIGGVVGLVIGAVLTLILGLVAKRRQGEALAIQLDVR